MLSLARLAAAIAALGFLAAEAQGPPSTFSYGHEPGQRVPAVAFEDTKGRRGKLDAIAGREVAVLIVTDAECPVSQRYAPRVREMANRYAKLGVDFIWLDVTPYSDAQKKTVRRASGRMRTLLDEGKVVSSALRLESTAEAFVIDRAGTLRYRGAIDDQYGLDHQRARPEQSWLRDAVESVSRGEEPPVRRTSAKGCPLAVSAASPVHSRPVTFHGRVSRILQRHCQDCHRRDGIAPMPLETYAQVYERRAVIDVMVKSGRMPPWSAHGGDWANDRSLSPGDREALLSWARGEAAEGDPREAPVPRRFTRGWHIGTPDVVLKLPDRFRIPKEGAVEYKFSYLQTRFPEDRWISAIEIRPSQPRVVHHMLAFLEEPGRKWWTAEDEARRKPGEPRPPQPSDGNDGFFAATVPGYGGVTFPPGFAKRLPKGAWIKFQIHYQPNGTEVWDQTEIAFKFARPPVKEVESRAASNRQFTIPPHAAKHPVSATYEFAQSGSLVSLFPHMHFRGAAFRYELVQPDGRRQLLLDVPRFDFNWQGYYEFRTPARVAKGSRLLATAWYDNSRANPWNPDPSKTVRYGEQTWDEMMIGYFDFVAD